MLAMRLLHWSVNDRLWTPADAGGAIALGT